MTDMPAETQTQPAFQSSTDVKLDYIQRDISKIELNISAIKADNIGRREYTDGLQALRKEFNDANLQMKTEFLDAVKSVKKDLDLPKKILYGLMSAVGLTVLYALLSRVIIK